MGGSISTSVSQEGLLTLVSQERLRTVLPTFNVSQDKINQFISSLTQKCPQQFPNYYSLDDPNFFKWVNANIPKQSIQNLRNAISPYFVYVDQNYHDSISKW